MIIVLILINIVIIPTIPPVFPMIFVAPTTVSKLLEKNFPTTGIKFEIAEPATSTVNESIELDKVVSSERIPKNKVRHIPTIHITHLLKNLDISENLKLSHIAEIIFNATDTVRSGITTYVTIYPIKLDINKSKGCINPVVVIPPVPISIAIKNGDTICIILESMSVVFLKISIVSNFNSSIFFNISIISLFFSNAIPFIIAIITIIISIIIPPLSEDLISLKKLDVIIVNKFL